MKKNGLMTMPNKKDEKKMPPTIEEINNSVKALERKVVRTQKTAEQALAGNGGVDCETSQQMSPRGLRPHKATVGRRDSSMQKLAKLHQDTNSTSRRSSIANKSMEKDQLNNLAKNTQKHLQIEKPAPKVVILKSDPVSPVVEDPKSPMKKL